MAVFLLIVLNVLIMVSLYGFYILLSVFVLPLLGIQISSISANYFLFAAVFGFGSALISLLMSKSIVKRYYNMQRVTAPQTDKESVVYETVKRISKKEGIKMPEVWVYWDDAPNAFATGPSKNRSMVAVSSGLANRLTGVELESVVAHEMGHVKSGDMLTSTLIQGLMNTFVFFASKLLTRGIKERNFIVGVLLDIALQIALSILAMIPVLWFSRKREYAADLYAAAATSKEAMISSLRSITSYYDSVETESALHSMQNDPVATLKVSGPSSSSWLKKIYSSHPTLAERIENIKINAR